MANDELPILLATIEDRKLKIEERKLGIEEMRLDMEMRSLRTPEEQALELEQRLATGLAKSPFLPDNVGKDMAGRIAAGFGIMRFARMLGADPYVVAQNIYVVHGRIGFSSAFLIAVVNARANLQRALDWTVTGSGDALSVVCSCVDAHGVERSISMDMTQVKVWGWAAKSDPWRADPGLMLRYRTAAKLIRLYLGSAVMGLTMTAEELRDGEPQRVTVGAPSPKLLANNLGIEDAKNSETVLVDADPFAAIGLTTADVADWYRETGKGTLPTDPERLAIVLANLAPGTAWGDLIDATPFGSAMRAGQSPNPFAVFASSQRGFTPSTA